MSSRGIRRHCHHNRIRSHHLTVDPPVRATTTRSDGTAHGPAYGFGQPGALHPGLQQAVQDPAVDALEVVRDVELQVVPTALAGMHLAHERSQPAYGQVRALSRTCDTAGIDARPSPRRD